ncbi:hypothetical protein [Photorhabdus sp. RM71S]|uniref:hypothetical protein n=1 Tax=Photorhabdus sp. RM71S TaxID=3342824 RepID=UPI0036D87895
MKEWGDWLYLLRRPLVVLMETVINLYGVLFAVVISMPIALFLMSVNLFIFMKKYKNIAHRDKYFSDYVDCFLFIL